jgi:hypothetical protein
MITSFAGLVERFTHPDLTLYYTLTRKQSTIDPEHWHDPICRQYSDQPGRRVLYITLFDHKERTTRVYTRDGTTERFYSTKSDVPLIDLRHGLLETKLDEEIISKDDLIAGDPEIQSLLLKHYQSIMDQIHFTVGKTHDTTTTSPLPPAYTIENKWTMRAADAVGARERSRREETVKQGSGRTWESTVERGRRMEVDGSPPTLERDRLYLDHGRIEERQQSLDPARGRWIEMYMDFWTRDRLESETTAMRRVDGDPSENERAVEKKAFGSDEELNVVVEEVFIDERCTAQRVRI